MCRNVLKLHLILFVDAISYPFRKPYGRLANLGSWNTRLDISMAILKGISDTSTGLRTEMRIWSYSSSFRWWRHQMEHFSLYWPFMWLVHRSPVNSPYKDQWHGAFMFSLIFASIKGSVNNREAGDLRRHRAHYDVIVMKAMKRVTSRSCPFWI